MKKAQMIHEYRRFSAADAYMIGFVYQHNLYMAVVDEIAPRFMKVERESTKHGGHQKLQLRLNNKYMLQLIKRHNAVCLGSESLLGTVGNKGVKFERLMSEMNGIPFRGKDNVPFYKDGDLTVNGVSYQIKLNGAQIVVETTLKKCQKMAREARKAA